MSSRDADDDMQDIRNDTGTMRLNLGPLPMFRQPVVDPDPSTPLPLTPIPLDQLGSIRYANLYAPSGTDSLSTRSSSSSSSSSGLVAPQIIGSKRRRALVDDGDTTTPSKVSSDDATLHGGSWGVQRSANRGVKPRTSEGIWEEMDDFVLQSFLLHPLQPLAQPYPPGTLPDPPALDELTNQIMHYESLDHRSPRSKARTYSTRLRDRAKNPSDLDRKVTITDEDEDVDVDVDMTSDGKRRWSHTWKETRARLAHVARLLSKGYNTEELSRALGYASTEILVDESTAITSGDSGLAVASAAANTDDKTTIDMGPFKVGGIGPAVRSRSARPHIRRISSMDFLDTPDTVPEGIDMSGISSSAADTTSSETPKREEAALGRVLRLSTTLQNSSQHVPLQAPPPLLGPSGSPVNVSNNTLLSPPDTATAPVTRSTAIVNPRRSLRRRTSTKMSTGGAPRPTSLLQRGRSFTASDLSKEVEKVRDSMAAMRKADDDPIKNVAIDATDANDPMNVDSTAKALVTPVKEKEAAVGMRGTLATDSTTSDADSPSARLPLFPSPIYSGPTSTTLPSPIRPSIQPPPTLDFRLSAAQRPKRANSSITAAEYQRAPHEMQQLFIAPVKPSTTDPSKLLAPFSLDSARVATSSTILIDNEEDSDKEEDGLLMVKRKKGKLSHSAEKDSGRNGMEFDGIAAITRASGGEPN